MIKDIQTPDDFKTLLSTICNDLGRILDKWTLFNQLAEAQRAEFTKALSQSPGFWSMVYGSLQDAVVFGLCRAYDDHREALTLRTVIETLREGPSFMTGLPAIPDEQLQTDLASVSRRTSENVKHLLMWRDKFYAHRDAGKIVRGWTLAEEAPLTYGDVNALIKNGFRIVNGYSATIFGVSNLPKMIGADDYMKVLRIIQADVEAREACGFRKF